MLAGMGRWFTGPYRLQAQDTSSLLAQPDSYRRTALIEASLRDTENQVERRNMHQSISDVMLVEPKFITDVPLILVAWRRASLPAGFGKIHQPLSPQSRQAGTPAATHRALVCHDALRKFRPKL